MGKSRADGFVMISIIAERYNIHPQMLRLYEREGLIKPARTNGNTRLYGEDEIRKLEMILTLTRDLGVNLAGVEIVLNMRRKMEHMQREMNEFVGHVREELGKINSPAVSERIEQALVRVTPATIVRAETVPGPGDDGDL